jgi:Na+/H+-dicarboxylate symporter
LPDMFRTVTNVIGNMTCSVVISASEEKDSS